MHRPKSSHLVERAAESLLQAGALESSAAQLLGSDRPPLVPHAGSHAPNFADFEALAGSLPPREPESTEAPRQRAPRRVIETAGLEHVGMVDWFRGRSRIAEEFRLAQQHLLRAAFAPDAKAGFSNLLMVTSARPGEGKSFAALNLAGGIAQQGDHHVLLIDSDSKHGSICQPLGLLEAPGILDLVANPNLDPADVILRTEVENLSFLPIGQERGRSSELFASRDMMQLIQRLGRRYTDRLLILDTAPCLSTSDPAALAPIVAQILFVVEAERTQRDEVEAALDLIQACPAILLLLNKVQARSSYTFGAYLNH